MKKRIVIGIIVVIFLILLIPIPFKLRDGGSIEFKAILYTITKYHKLNEISEDQQEIYTDGFRIEILGIEICDSTK